MINKEFVVPAFVKNPNIKNEGMEFEETPIDPYSSAYGEKVDKAEVKDVDIDEEKSQKIGKTAFEFLQSVGEGIL
ncbi:hypothetical protein IK110_03705 [Candidatus Saccharibacteria bacterium]|nr:hypothetical protein [Candidatus Saccharibacteria bacterium]